MQVARILGALAAATLAGLGAACASNPAPPPAALSTALYSVAERAGLFGCSALTDSAMIIAAMKQKGAPIQDAKGFFAARPNSELTFAVADEVYDQRVGNVWDYAAGFFADCAANVSRVPRDRSGPAGLCMLDSMAAATAQASQQAGVPIDEVDRYFAGFPGEPPKAIIARAYARPQTRAAAQAQAWNACMDRISGG